MFSCTISPIWWPLGCSTMIRDFISFAGRVSRSTVLPVVSRTSSRCVMNWSQLERNRTAFFSALCPTSATEPICCPAWLNTEYSLAISMSLTFWFTTSTGSVNRVPPPPATGPTPAFCCTCCWMRDGSCCRPSFTSQALPSLACWVACVHCVPSHQRRTRDPGCSGYHPGGWFTVDQSFPSRSVPAATALQAARQTDWEQLSQPDHEFV